MGETDQMFAGSKRTGDILDLVRYGALNKDPAGGRSTSYSPNQ